VSPLGLAYLSACQTSNRPLCTWQYEAEMSAASPDTSVDARPEDRGAAQRSRTGCLTCRRRKVKCDERPPICGKCQIKRREVTLSPGPWVAAELDFSVFGHHPICQRAIVRGRERRTSSRRRRVGNHLRLCPDLRQHPRHCMAGISSPSQYHPRPLPVSRQDMHPQVPMRFISRPTFFLRTPPPRQACLPGTSLRPSLCRMQ
jgi:hypothetical protein